MSSPSPVVAWGMDVIGTIEPTSSNGHRFILVAIDYLTKWVEAASYKSLADERDMLATLYYSSKVKCLSPPNERRFRGRQQEYQKDFEENDRQTARLSNDGQNIEWATPYLLVYGTEAVVPVEVEIPFLRIIQEAELSNAEWVNKRIDQLALIDVKRMVAIFHGQLYRQRMTRAFSQQSKSQKFRCSSIGS
nr:uncharacterized protein LOC101251984 [Solanum lycopersicum]